MLEWHLTEGLNTLGSGSDASLTPPGHNYFWLPVRKRQVQKRNSNWLTLWNYVQETYMYTRVNNTLVWIRKMLESTLICTICRYTWQCCKKIVICFFLWKKDSQVLMTHGLSYFEGTLEPVFNCFKQPNVPTPALHTIQHSQSYIRIICDNSSWCIVLAVMGAVFLM